MNEKMSKSQRTRVVICHVPKDKKWLERIQVHLKPLEMQGQIAVWDDTRTQAGGNSYEEMDLALRTAHIALLLVSADFLASSMIIDEALPRLLRAHAKSGARIIPLIVGPCLMESSPLRDFRAAGVERLPLSKLKAADSEELLRDLARQIFESLPGRGVAAGASPDSGYEPARYIHRQREETTALSLLDAVGTPILLWGPARSGKTWLLQHLLDASQRRTDHRNTIVRLDFQTWSPEQTQTLDGFARAFAETLTQTVCGSVSPVADVWARPTGSGPKLRKILQEHVLPRVPHRLAIALDGADRLFGSSYDDEFFGFLRSWVQRVDGPWAKLRLLLALSTSPRHLNQKATQSPFFNVVMQIRVGDFDLEQVHQMLERRLAIADPAKAHSVMSLVGGNPYLLDILINNVLHKGLSLDDVFEDQQAIDAIFGEHLSRCAKLLQDSTQLLQGLAQALREPSKPLEAELFEQLHLAAFVNWDNQARCYRIPYRLYEPLFRKLCQVK